MEEEKVNLETPKKELKQDENKWYDIKFEHLACQLPASILQDMKERILSSKINRIKLDLNDTSENMENFFIKEIQCYNKKLNRQQEFTEKEAAIN